LVDVRLDGRPVVEDDIAKRRDAPFVRQPADVNPGDSAAGLDANGTDDTTGDL
jgi:hypothetical protein